MPQFIYALKDTDFLRRFKKISKKNSFKIYLAVKNLDQEPELETVHSSKQELSKIMDDIWQRYPMAEVAKTRDSKGKNLIVFEV